MTFYVFLMSMNETDKNKLYKEDIDRIAEGIREHIDESCSEFATDQKIKALEIVLKDFQDFNKRRLS